MSKARDQQFSGPASPSLEMTPLGAAIVEAMPDQKRVRAIQRAFKSSGQCPASTLFSAAQVVAFYKARGQSVAVSKQRGVK